MGVRTGSTISRVERQPFSRYSTKLMIRLLLKRFYHACLRSTLVWVRARERRTAAHICAQPFFDEAFYLSRYPEVSDSGLDAVSHYCRWCDAAAYWPHPLFDSIPLFIPISRASNIGGTQAPPPSHTEFRSGTPQPTSTLRCGVLLSAIRRDSSSRREPAAPLSESISRQQLSDFWAA